MRFESPAILKRLAAASRQLAELKGVAAFIPNRSILVNSLGIQEAKDSSAIENIVTTHDELFRDAAFPDAGSPAAKEVLRYRQALGVGFDLVSATGVLSNNHILRIQETLERNEAGFRRVQERLSTMLPDAWFTLRRRMRRKCSSSWRAWRASSTAVPTQPTHLSGWR